MYNQKEKQFVEGPLRECLLQMYSGISDVWYDTDDEYGQAAVRILMDGKEYSVNVSGDSPLGIYEDVYHQFTSKYL